QAGLLVQLDDRGLGVRPQLGRGRAQGVGSLQRVAALHAAVTRAAVADVDIELPVDWSSGDLDLVLVGDVTFLDRPTTVGTNVGQQRLVDLVGLPRRRQAMALAAVVGSGLAAGPHGRGLRRLLGERSGLTLPSAAGFVQVLLEAFDLRLPFGDAAVPLATGQADVSVHPRKDSKNPGCQLRRPSPHPTTPRPDPLNKYR